MPTPYYPKPKSENEIRHGRMSDRYQVKIRSKDSAFTESDHTKWLKRFDLRGLSKLK